MENKDPKQERPAYQVRVIEEKASLDEKLSKLSNFLGGDSVEMSAIDRDLLVAQGNAMTTYSEILGQRISRF